jgi:hypothetical protein
MRKFTLALLTVMVLCLGSAFAQTGYWGGVSFGFPGVNVHFGIEDLTPAFDLRANLGFSYFGGGFTLGADALFALPIETTAPIDVYAGGGPLIAAGGAAGFGFGINVLAGLEYRLTELNFPEGGVFVEIGPTLLFVPAFGGGFVGRAGFNYHF